MAHDIADFDFELPPERIAQHPARPRDAARLLHIACDGLADRMVGDLPQLLRPGDVVVANDTRVIPAQLTARRLRAGDAQTARIGITLDRPRADGAWHALARNARRLREGDVLRFDGADDLAATVTQRDADGGVALAFDRAGEAFVEALRRAGALALPPYIARPHGPLPEDAADYQTIFARHEGAVAAPTAGLHFTPALLAALDARGIRRVTLTLHVGAGTFLPVRGDDIARHHIHAEHGEITPAAAAAINAARAAGGRVVAVGTTSVRLLETAVDAAGPRDLHPFAGDTELFVLPGLSVPRGRSAVDQFPPAALDAVHAGLRLRRDGAYAFRLCACRGCRLPILLVRRRLLARTGGVSCSPVRFPTLRHVGLHPGLRHARRRPNVSRATFAGVASTQPLANDWEDLR